MTKENVITNGVIPKKTFWERNRLSEGYLLKKVSFDVAFRICRTILLFGMCFLILQPILNKISVSFMTEEDLYNLMVINIPENFTLGNYQLAAEFMSFGKSLLNTLLVSLTVAVLQITMCTLVGQGPKISHAMRHPPPPKKNQTHCQFPV